MKREEILALGLFMVLLVLVALIVVYVPKTSLAIPRSEDDIRRIVREEMERAKTGAAPAEEGR